MASSAVATQASESVIDYSEVKDKLQGKTGLDLIWDSRVVFAELLFCFRECHDLCVDSGLFRKEVILKVDQCAVDFRRLSLDSVSIAKRVSNQWLDTALATFENIKDIDDPKAMLELLGDQAKELARCFKVIAAWSRDLAGRFHTAQDGTIKEAEAFKREFASALQDAQDDFKRLKSELEKASRQREKSDKVKDSWTARRMEVTFNPFKRIYRSVGSSLANSRSVDANELEREANQKLKQAKENLRERTSEDEKAKFIAEKAGSLVRVLRTLESTCEAIAGFWTVEAENFASQGAKMRINQKKIVSALKDKVGKDNIAFWTKAKEEMDRYVVAMSAVNNCYNFVTEARAPESLKVEYEQLDIILHVPKSVDLKEIGD